MAEPQHPGNRATRHRLPRLAALLAVASCAIAQAQTANSSSKAPAKPVSAKQQLAAEDQYIAGARALDRGDPAKAEKDFANAARLDPERPAYAVAVGIAREHVVNDLIRRSSQAQRDGQPDQSKKLIEQARAVDPENQMIQAHAQGPSSAASWTTLPASPAASATPNFPARMSETALQAANAAMPTQAPLAAAGQQALPPARPQLLVQPLADASLDPESPLPAPAGLAGPLQLVCNPAPRSFHFRSDAQDLLRRVYTAYGITPSFDSSVQPQSVRLDIDDATWPQALEATGLLTNTFLVPLSEKTGLVVKETPENRQQFERLSAETVFVPGLTPEQMSDMGNLVRLLFGVQHATVQTAAESLTLRGPPPILRLINSTLADLLDGGGELLLDMHLYEVDRTRTVNFGPQFPQTTTLFNYDSALANAISANQSEIDLLLSQGLTLPQAIAGLIAAGACASSPLCSPFATFGGGLTKTGVGVQGVNLSLALNSSSVHAIDDVQVRVGDHQTATFRNGTRYPIVTSSASYGAVAGAGTTSGLLASLGLTQQQLSALGLGSAANLAALEPQPYPLVQYEDLGLTLKATPVIQRSGDISLHLDLQLEALTGASLDGNPVLSSRQFTSDITVKEGTSAIVVSAVSKTESNALSGLPFLSELPGFFNTVTSDVNNEVDKQELVMVVTPHVVRRRKDELSSPMVAIPRHEIPAS